MNLPVAYEDRFSDLLEAVAAAGAMDPETPVVPFWPLKGRQYDSELLVIGRSVNGWVQDWTLTQLRDPKTRRDAVLAMRRDAEPADQDRMGWVEDLWGAMDGYNTRRSAFWRVMRHLTGDGEGQPGWAGRLVWTNLYKASPAAGWNPGADLQRAQRSHAIELLRIELKTFAPRRVLALTGGWIGPFKDGLGLELDARPGLVEGAGSDGARPWVVAKHPMRKPEGEFVATVRSAFESLGAPLS